MTGIYLCRSNHGNMKPFKFLAMLFMFLTFGVTFSACSDSDEPDNSNSYYDFSIVWDVVDKGDYTTAEAQQLVANFTSIGEEIFEGMTEAQAKETFNEFCEQLRYQFATGYMKITIKANLIRIEGSKKIASKTFYIKPEGTTINAPAANGQMTDVEIITGE